MTIIQFPVRQRRRELELQEVSFTTTTRKWFGLRTSSCVRSFRQGDRVTIKYLSDIHTLGYSFHGAGPSGGRIKRIWEDVAGKKYIAISSPIHELLPDLLESVVAVADILEIAQPEQMQNQVLSGLVAIFRH